MAYECQLVERPARPMLSVRFRSPVQDLPQHFEKIYGMIVQYLGELGVQPADAPFAAYYNMDMQDLDVEAGFPVSKPVPGKDDVRAGELPAGKSASCMFVGSYDQVGPAYDALMKWIGDNGYEATGMCYEWYLNDPREGPGQEPITRIEMPLKG